MFLLLALVSTAWGQRNASEAEREMGRLLDDSRRAYDNLELDRAEDAIDAAAALTRDFRIRTPLAAQVYIQRGILNHVRSKDEGSRRTVDDFTTALEIDPRAQLDSLVSTPTLDRLFSEARDRVGGGRRRDPPRRERAPDIEHEPVREARGGEDLRLQVNLDPAISRQVYRMYVYFRSAKTDALQPIEMEPVGETGFTTTIPGRYVAGRSLTYYIAAEDRRRNTVASVGSPQRPIDVVITGGAYSDLASGSSLTGDPDGEDDFYGDDDEGAAGPRKFVSISLSVGTGLGHITELATPERLSARRVVPGVALSPFHSLVEIDFWASRTFGLGAYARIQIVEFAHLEGGRLKYKVLNKPSQSLELRAGGGIGRIRHLVDLGPFTDTTLEGPYHYTLGVCYAHRISKTFEFVATPDFFHLFGTSPSYHFDVNLGMRAGF